MFILRSNSRYATPLANSKHIALLNDIGASEIAKLPQGKEILTRLVDSGYLAEGNY
jgi:hypothetical protein